MQKLAFETLWFRNGATYRLSFSSFVNSMVPGGSVICTTTPKYRDISPTPPHNFTGYQKVRFFWPYRSTTLNFEPLWFGNRARYLHRFLNCVCSDDLTMFSPSLMQIGPRVFKITPSSCGALPKKRTKNLTLIVNNSAADRLILFKFGTYIDHMTRHLPYMFKDKGSKVKVIA